MPFTTQIAQEEANRRFLHEAEARRQTLSGFGCDLGPFIGRTPAEIAAEAQRRSDLHRAPDAVLIRSLMDAAKQADAAGDLGRLSQIIAALAAADRGDHGWQDRARALLNSNQAKAA